MGFEDRQTTARLELCARIDALGRGIGRMDAHGLAQELDAVRRLAVANGMVSAVTLVHAVERTLAQGERGPMVRSWLDTLAELCGCPGADDAAGESFAAAVSVRLG